MSKKDWIACLRYDNHSKPNSQHNEGGIYDHLMSTRKFAFDNKQEIHMSSNKFEESGYSLPFGLANHLVPITCFVS